MNKRFSAAELYQIRTYLPIRAVIEELLGISCKEIEGISRFVCPACFEMQTGINFRTNLSRCFRCQSNFNTVDLVMHVRQCSFVVAVKLLQEYWRKLALQKPSFDTLRVDC